MGSSPYFSTFVIKKLTVDPKAPSRLGAIAAALVQYPHDHMSFKPRNGSRKVAVRPSSRTDVTQTGMLPEKAEIASADHVVAAQYEGSFDGIPEFADVA